MTWTNLKFDDENKFPGLVRIPQSGRSFYLTLSDGGNPEVRLEVFWWLLSRMFFFEDVFFRKGWFFGIIQSDQNRKWPKPEMWTIRSWTHKFLHTVLQESTDGTDVSFWHGSITIKTQRDRTVSYSPISGGLKNREALNISVTNQQHWFSRKQSGHLVDFAFEDYLNSLMVHLLALWFHTLPQKNV